MSAEAIPLAEIRREAIQILFGEIGVVNTVRFLNQFTHGLGDYTEERKELFEQQTLDDLIVAAKQRRTSRADTGQHGEDVA